MATECEVTWALVGQAAQGARDQDLLEVVQRCDGEVAAQLKWLRTRMKQAAPRRCWWPTDQPDSAGQQAVHGRLGGALAAHAVAEQGAVTVRGAGRLQVQLGGQGPPAGPVGRRLVEVVDLQAVGPAAAMARMTGSGVAPAWTDGWASTATPPARGSARPPPPG